MGMTRFNTLLLLFLTLLLMLSGCVDRSQLKADVQEAVKKQGELRDYRFSGSLRLTDSSPSPAGGPVPGIWPDWPADVTITWQGVASYDPLRAEADIRITAPDRDPVVLPLVIQHNKMAFRLPGVLPDDAYLAVDLQQLAEKSGNRTWPGPAESGHWFAELAGAMLAHVSPDRFDEPDDRLEFRRITVTYNEKQAEAFGDIWTVAWPEVQGALADAGFPAGRMAPAPATFTLHEPVRLAFDLTEDGFVEQFRAVANLSWQRDNGESGNRVIRLVHRQDDINAGQTFVRDMPDVTIPFDELLKRLPSVSGESGQTDQAGDAG